MNSAKSKRSHHDSAWLAAPRRPTSRLMTMHEEARGGHAQSADVLPGQQVQLDDRSDVGSLRIWSKTANISVPLPPDCLCLADHTTPDSKGYGRRGKSVDHAADTNGGMPGDQKDVGQVPVRVPNGELADIIGVRSRDHFGLDLGRRTETVPRLTFKPLHAVIAVMLLLAALCASLTMLIRQSLNFSALETAQTATEPNTQEKQGAPGMSDGEQGSGRDSPEAGQRRSSSDRQSSNNQNEEDSFTEQQRNLDGERTTGSGHTQSEQRARGDPDQGKVDLNSASSEELDGIQGIGPVTAKRIVEYRRRIGRFASIHQLLEVDRIGPKTLEKLRPQVCVR